MQFCDAHSHYYLLNHKARMMLLNFKDVEELKLIKDALYFYCYNLPSGDDTFKCYKLIGKFAEEIEYYETQK